MTLSEPQKSPGFRDETKTLSPYQNLLAEQLCDFGEKGINEK